MLNPNEIDNFYKQFIANLPDLAHDGILTVDLSLLHDLKLLNDPDQIKDDPEDLTQYFHVIENTEKVTLFNEQFLVWIVPKTEQEIPLTYVLIALNRPGKTSLEVVFTTSGVYNTPKYVLKVLQYYLLDMLETEAALTSIEKNQ
ncbi:MAG: hypothetical protein A3F40_05120 [Chlamydiae bacterium RIFCSPHIGHO2_12_FULL_27_8]|nr:MAG: hypothetical protein A3F40_05120 [Chlamydiae bacterium RIFCSPHIGHO2_12_FULL_27_8]OGN64903.1 MAG: hypothetical protein A2888_03055 [Chlamydiae bacterium RIFCSPLOWO2_01_FULL_28_7]